MTAEAECRDKQIGVSITVAGMEGGDSRCTTSDTSSGQGDLRQAGSTTYYTQGSNPPPDLKSKMHISVVACKKNINEIFPGWDASNIFRPIPVKSSLTLIVSLFTPTLLDPLGISPSAILDWFTPRWCLLTMSYSIVVNWSLYRYETHCETLNRLRPADEQFDCSGAEGCGADDECPFGTQCIEDESRTQGYRCGNWRPYWNCSYFLLLISTIYCRISHLRNPSWRLHLPLHLRGRPLSHLRGHCRHVRGLLVPHQGPGQLGALGKLSALGILRKWMWKEAFARILSQWEFTSHFSIGPVHTRFETSFTSV